MSDATEIGFTVEVTRREPFIYRIFPPVFVGIGFGLTAAWGWFLVYELASLVR
jgi:hypothetical protein